MSRYSEQNADERIAASEDRAREAMEELDLAELLADEQVDQERDGYFDHWFERVTR